MRLVCGVLFAMVAMLTMSGVAAEPSTNAAASSPAPADTARHGRRHLVVLKQTAISGRVLLIKENEDLAASTNLTIHVSSHNSEKPLYKTVTDNTGTFTLPNLDAGMYQITAGRLSMDLKVDNPETSHGKTRIPKTVLIVMPESLTQ